MRWLRDNRSVIVLPHGVDVFLRVASRIWLLVVVAVFTYEAWQGNIPRDPEGGPFTEDVLVPVQLGLLALTALGVAISFRWIAVAAAVVAVGGSGLGVLATLEYEPPFGLLVVAVFGVPAVMMWLDWQHRETLGKIIVLAASTGAILLGTWIAATEVYATYLGPTHPESTTATLPRSPVRWLWSGAVTPTGFTVTARLEAETDAARLIVFDHDDTQIASSPLLSVTDTAEPAVFTVDGLEPETEYQYTIEIDGDIDPVRRGRVQTFPAGPSSFTVAVGSCARTNSNGVVFDTIRELDPDLYLNLGDLHYRNIGENDLSPFRAAFDQVHASPAQSALYRSVPIAYVWDDHDYGPNDADGSSPSRPAAWAAYRSHVPHYELPSGAEGPINQAFTIGRVRFLLTDTRSARDRTRGHMLGESQLEWFLEEVLRARDTHALTVWANPTPWIGVPEPLAQHWAAFDLERQRIGAFLAEHDITNLVMVSGDAHMVAIDDGTNSGYGGHHGFPVLQAAALDRPGSIKGGPYSHGTFPGGGQFGLLDVTDNGGDQLHVTLTGLDYTGDELVTLELTYEL